MRFSSLPSSSRRRALAAVAVSLLVLTGCSTTAPTAVPHERSDSASGGHGFVEGAEELSEAQLSLVSGATDGALTRRDLVTDDVDALLAATDAEVAGVTGDGRFVFRTEVAGDETTVRIVDSGVWTVEHGDHFHYYRAEPREIGTVAGSGPAVVRTADRRTAITFPEAGEVAVVAHDDLEDGVVGEPVRVSITAHAGALGMPLGDTVLVTSPDAKGVPATVEAISLEDATPVAAAVCPAASSATLTRVGAVFTCAGGAVLATADGDEVDVEEIPYPAGADAPAASTMHGRVGRPDVAGVAGDAGAWRLDSRAREWHFLPTDTDLLTVSAVSDDADLVVAVDMTGRILVLDESGRPRATTDPVLAASVERPDAASRIRLIVDAQRAYVSDPVGDRVLEIDYRDDARIARILPVADPVFLEQVG